jgi:HK97 family phage major capsid protein
MKPDTKEKLAEASTALTAKENECKAAWAVLGDAKAKAIAAGASALDEQSPEFVALDAAGRTYDGLCDEFNSMKAAFNRMAEAIDGEAPRSEHHLPGGALLPMVAGDTDAFSRNVDEFMDGFAEWRDAVGEQTLKNPKGRFGNSPEFRLIARDDFRAATVATTAYPSINTRRPGIVPLVKETVELLDLIPMVPVDHDTVEYVYEKTFTNTAAETAEGVDAAIASEGTIALDVASVACKWIPFTIPATRQILSDEPRMRAFISDRIIYGVRQRLQTQILDGNAQGQNLRGILNWANILVQDVLGTDGVPDLVHRAKTKIRVASKGMYEPTVLLMHPNDEEMLVLAKDKNDNYLFGGPQREGLTCWGMIPVSHVSVPEGEPLVCDVQACEAYIREDVTLSVTDSHDDHFTKGIIDFLASGRFGFAVLEPKAFCVITAFAS